MQTIAFLYDSVLNIGGVESHLLSILEHRDTTRYSYVLISEVSDRFSSKVKELGVEIVPFINRHPLNLITPFKLARILRKKNIDLVHAHSPTASLWGRFAARLVNVPFVATVHLPVGQYHGNSQTFRARLGRKIYNKMDDWLNHNPDFTRKMVYVSQEVYADEISNGHSPANLSIVIPNGIDLRPFNQITRKSARKYYGLSAKKKIITFIGRLEEQKGLDILLNAVVIIKTLNVDFLVWLVGDGRLRKDLNKQVDLLELRDRVKFWGYREDIPRILKASDIYILPSRYEGMPLGLLMGMAACLPIVVTHVGENIRLIENNVHGLVVQPEDKDGMADALKTLLSDQSLGKRLSKSARERVTEFSDELMVKRITEVYKELLRVD